MNDSGIPTSEQILTLVQGVFAGAALTSCRLFAGRHDNVNLDLHLSNPTMQVVLKVYTSADSRRTPWKETYLLRTLTSETGVPVPRVLHFDDTETLLTHPWALHTRLPGEPLATVASALDEFELESVGYEAGRYLAHLHQIPLTEFGSLFAASSADRTSERAYVLAAISQLAEACTGRQLAPAEVVEQFRRLVGCDGCLDRQQPCLLHGDYTPENIIVERGSTGYHVTGLLEFEQALGAGPERDIATLLNWGMEEWPTFQRGFLDGYAESGAVVPRFWPRLRLYQALVSVEHLVALGTARPETIAECRRRIAEALAL